MLLCFPPDKIEHHHIKSSRPAGDRLFRHHGFNEKQFGPGGCSTTDCAKYLFSMLVIPIVNHFHEHIDVGFGQLVLEEVAAKYFESLAGDASRLLHNMRLIEEDSVRERSRSQYCGQQMALAAANISDPVKLGEIVGS